MNKGRVYLWDPAKGDTYVRQETVDLERLTPAGVGPQRLIGEFVEVRNCGVVTRPVKDSPTPIIWRVGDAEPDENGDFLFEPRNGGRRVDRRRIPTRIPREAYVEASRFGEVNTYYHLDRCASYTHGLLERLGHPGLPRVIAKVSAHGATSEIDGARDGAYRKSKWFPFQGAHYRLPGKAITICEHYPIESTGEIHIGPGRRLLKGGALLNPANGNYRANASHNAGILYHEYGHHIARHTADFRANAFRPVDRQSNRKTDLDEAFCDYWAAALLGTPHIWALHHRHDSESVHSRSLLSRKTMESFDAGLDADPHANGTIWASALWELRSALEALEPDGCVNCDLLVLKSLIQIGTYQGTRLPPTPRSISAARNGFRVGLRALLEADEELFRGNHSDLIRRIFASRGIGEHESDTASKPHLSIPDLKWISRVQDLREVPEDCEILSASEVSRIVGHSNDYRFDVLIGGDVMLGGRAKSNVGRLGMHYPFAAVLPLLQASRTVCVNLEGPFAKDAEREPRNHSYRVNPKLARALPAANIKVVALANNHLLDCGREGVTETLETLTKHEISWIGGGANESVAHRPFVFNGETHSVGLLNYYWNRRTSARRKLPGSALATIENLKRDIAALQAQAERVAVIFHWGVPYVATPSDDDAAMARAAIDFGADAVVGHHPHVIQPLEVYRGKPIFYSVGNFAFGSGNSKAQGLLIGIRFETEATVARVFPLYVKNRDQRADYQPKLLAGATSGHAISLLQCPDVFEAKELGAEGRFPRRVEDKAVGK